MPEPTPRPSADSDRREASDFAREADRAQAGIARELLDFLLHNKKWWLAPILIILALFGLLIIFGGTAAAPFIYTLF